MSLNDHFTLPTQDEDLEANPRPSVDVFAPAALGEAPELLDDVEFVAVPDKQLVEDRAAMESVCVAMRDIQLFRQEIDAKGGISLNMALEAMSFLPGLVTKENPKEYYTQNASRTMLTHALEEQEVETKSLIQRGLDVLRNFVGRIVAWFKDKVGKLLNKDKLEEAKKREEELNKKLQEANEKSAEIAEKYSQLQAAAAQDNDNFLKELAALKGVEAKLRQDINAVGQDLKRTQGENTDLAKQLRQQQEQAKAALDKAKQVEQEAIRSGADATQARAQLQAAQQKLSQVETQLAEEQGKSAKLEGEAASAKQQNAEASISIENLKTSLRDVQAQMRNLDATKSREIAESLDRLEKLQRQAESSRSARLDLQEKSDELRVTVNRIIVKVFAEKLGVKKNELAEAYNAFARSRILGSKLVSKYMLGNGIQRRTQGIVTKAEFMVKANVMIDHAKKVREGLASVETNPQKLVDALKSFDFSKVTTGDEVTMKTEFTEKDLEGIPAARLEGFIKEMQVASVEAFKKAEGFRFGELVREFEEILKEIQGDTRLKMDYKFANPVVEAYKETQAHLTKVLPYIQRAAQTAQELISLSSSLVAVMPARAAFASSEQFKTFVGGVINETAAYVSVSPNFIRPDDADIVGLSIAALEQLSRG